MLGLTSVTFRKLSSREIVSLASKTGVQVIEWGGDVHVTDTHSAREVKNMCDAQDIAVHSFGSYYRLGEGAQPHFGEVCEIASSLGAGIIRVWCGSRGSAQTSQDELMRLVEESRAICDTAAGYGQRVAFEFHKGTYNDCAESSVRFLSLADTPNLKTYWQPMFAGEDSENLKAVIHNTEVVHMFNWSRLCVRYSLARGEKKLMPFMNILREKSFSGDVILEFVKGDSPAQFEEDFQVLKRLSGGDSTWL